VPTIAVHTHVFARLVKSVTQVSSMPTARQAFVPQPIVGRTPAELRAYIEGMDPVHKRPFIQVMMEGLTNPLNAEDLKGMTFDRSTPRTLEPDTEANLQQLFTNNNWTDFLPVVLPTEERVEQILDFLGDALAVVGHRDDSLSDFLGGGTFVLLVETSVSVLRLMVVIGTLDLPRRQPKSTAYFVERRLTARDVF